MSTSLYFIAVVPPDPLREELMERKKYFQTRYNSKASLNSDPHITLHMPFRSKESKREKLLKVLREPAKFISSFDVKLNGYAAFEPRVIFVDVEKSEELFHLQKEVVNTCRHKLNLDNASYRNRGFHPHITMAFRDLKKSKFIEAWEEFRNKEFSATFTVSEYQLLRHDGKLWRTDQVYTLERN